jgi:predicted O-linked N-acetylglucosamine transferase (SPINDLY family)
VAVREDRPAAFPFVFFSVSDSCELQLRCARRFAARYRPDAAPLWQGELYRHDRIRIAYVSEDFRTHPTSFLMMELWERHDRQRFETIAISLRRAEDSDVGRRAAAAFDRFIDVSMLADAAIAQRMRELEVDIAVDLMGYTGGVLHPIFTPRPAPVQVNYLGYPGTLGSADADYLIADEFLIPGADRAHYSEQIVYLPGTYQPNDRRRATSSPPSRADCGLPSDAFVWCCFNNAYKFNPSLFEVWCRLLAAVPESVLWLIPGAKETEKNLQMEAAARHIDPARLIFAPNVSNSDHVARIALADLCLDTAPVNGATTTSDALWAGVPVVTCAGRSFVSRMAGSLLSAAGLAELITTDREEYESLALALARNPERLGELRTRLRDSRSTCRLFDADRTRRHLESAFLTMWQRTQQGQPPAGFMVQECS